MAIDSPTTISAGAVQEEEHVHQNGADDDVRPSADLDLNLDQAIHKEEEAREEDHPSSPSSKRLCVQAADQDAEVEDVMAENPSSAERAPFPICETLPPPPPLPPTLKPSTLSPEARRSLSSPSSEQRRCHTPSPHRRPSPEAARSLHSLSPVMTEGKASSPRGVSAEKEPVSSSPRRRSRSRSPPRRHSPSGVRSCSRSPPRRHSPSGVRRHDQHSPPPDSSRKSPARSPGGRSGRYGRSRSRSPAMRSHRQSPRTRYSSRERYSPRRWSPPSSHRSRRRYSPGSRRARSPLNTGLGGPGNHLFVAGLSFSTTERDLEKKFSRYGRVTEARIIRDKWSGDSRGFGFLSLEHDEDADAAIRGLDQTEWNGRRVLVEKARTSTRY